jgi:hypothetical protein
MGQGVHCPHPHIADSQPIETVNAAFFPQHRVKVRENLGGVLTPPISAIDDRDRGPFRRFMRGTLLEMAHDNHVPVELQHFDRIFDRFLIEISCPGHLWICKPQHVASKTVHGGFMCETGAGRWLIERSDEGFIRQKIAVPPITGDRFQSLRDLKHSEKLIAFKLFQGQNVTT